MQKTILLVPTMYAREMVPNADTEQKLASGSYLIGVKPKKQSAVAKRQRLFRDRRIADGFKRLDVLIDEQIYNALLARRRSGESFAALIKRLLELPDNDTHLFLGADTE